MPEANILINRRLAKVCEFRKQARAILDREVVGYCAKIRHARLKLAGLAKTATVAGPGAENARLRACIGSINVSEPHALHWQGRSGYNPESYVLYKTWGSGQARAGATRRRRCVPACTGVRLGSSQHPFSSTRSNRGPS